MIPDWSPVRKIKTEPAPRFEASVEIYAIEDGGQWAASLHARGKMRLLTGTGSLQAGVEDALREVQGRQHIEVMTGPAVQIETRHVVRLIARCSEGPQFERLRVALGMSQGGMAQKAGKWHEGLPEYRGRDKKKK